ncbi:hypothetical protein [Bradyrhizobium sp. Ash2021]|uniref:hypothetical protein n=1 Tax=Bradyrhizobium sp. Ash2021 TaxID=2954771 RepID=UPI0028168ED8|nr:hypothetical protein [Bradyrhizobium sp. Ash2021]WMT75579.1 hypothetical protein NL528_03940 [Bradyrhizobium sp. Ash2021]
MEGLVVWKLVQRAPLGITQTSAALLVLQSITCSRTTIEPASRWARGAMFWADNEASVATAPSGIMKKRKDGFSMFALLFGVGVALLTIDIGREFFRVMSSIVSFVSSPVIFGLEINPDFRPRPPFKYLK